MSADAERAWTCGICKEPQTPRHWELRGRDKLMPPICNGCERDHTHYYGWHGGVRQIAQPPKGGSLGDRRMAMRLLAISEALATTAQQIKWRNANGRA